MKIVIYFLSFVVCLFVVSPSTSLASSPDRIKMGTHFGSLLFEESCRTCGDDFVDQLDEQAPALLATLLEVPTWVFESRSSYGRVEIKDVTAARNGSENFSVTISVGWGDCGLGCVNRHEWKVQGRLYNNSGRVRPYIEVEESGRAVPRKWTGAGN